MRRSSSFPNCAANLQVEALEERCVPSTAEYVTGLYNALLHRSPAPAELAGWVDTLNTGAASPAQAAQSFTSSLEYASNEIETDYTILLGREPAPAEIAGWLQPLQAVGGEKQVEASFLASQEFFTRQGGSASSWLNGVYRDVLGRAPDAAGLNMWSQLLRAGAARATVAQAIVNSPEADGRLVSAAYLNLLGRGADPSGLAGWVAQLQQGLAPSSLMANFASSAEFISLKTHGGLDTPSTCSTPESAPAPADSSADVCVPAPSLGDGTATTDQGSYDGSSVDQGSDVSTIDPTSDCNTIDPGSDSSSADPGFDASGSDGGDNGSDCY